jgi:hypothetical protein
MTKLIIYLLAILLFGCSAKAQSFFKPLPRVTRMNFAMASGQTDSILNAFRPITNIAAYGEPGNILMAGAGVSYQHLQWDVVAQKWNCLWSISAMGWAGGSVAPSTPAQIGSYGILFGVLNNLIMAGPAINDGKLMAVVGIGINLNN